MRTSHTYQNLARAVLFACFFISITARANAESAPVLSTHPLLLQVQTQADSLAQPPAEGFDAFQRKVADTFRRVKASLGQYRPGGRANPVSQELLKVVFYFMASFVACIFIMLILIVVSRIRRGRRRRRHAELKTRFENILVELLYTHESEPDEAYMLKPAEELRVENDEELNESLSTEPSIVSQQTKTHPKPLSTYFDKEDLHKPFHREVLIEQIIELHKNLSGATSKVLRDLYLELGFDQDAIRRLKKYDWSVKAKAVRELAQMGISEAEPAIAELLNHSSSVLTLEVQIALLKLIREHPFSFLNDTEVEITNWQQVSMLAMISHSPHFKIPDFSQWLSSENDSVVLFVIKMINYYNQLEAADKMIALLSHPSDKIRAELIRTLGDMEVNEAENTLIEMYSQESEETKIDILIALGKIGTERATGFLQHALKSPEFPLAFHAAKGLMQSGPVGVELLEQAEKVDVQLQPIVKHLMDERI